MTILAPDGVLFLRRHDSTGRIGGRCPPCDILGPSTPWTDDDLTVTDYPKRFEWTLFMPVSREMSAGKRSVLRIVVLTE